jgi:hypothetical protein
MKNRTIYLALLLIAISFLSGCTYNVPPIDTTFPPNRYIEKLPITVGVYFSEEFQSYEIVHQMPQTAVAFLIKFSQKCLRKWLKSAAYLRCQKLRMISRLL